MEFFFYLGISIRGEYRIEMLQNKRQTKGDTMLIWKKSGTTIIFLIIFFISGCDIHIYEWRDMDDKLCLVCGGEDIQSQHCKKPSNTKKKCVRCEASGDIICF